MGLETLGGGGYDYVQNTAPTGIDIGETWLDTSTDPPIGKVYADLGGGGQWTTDLLDAQISSVGGVDWASKTEKQDEYDTDPYDGTTGFKSGLKVTGSGYITHIVLGANRPPGQSELAAKVDGSIVFNAGNDMVRDDNVWYAMDAASNDTITNWVSIDVLWRFDSSFNLGVNDISGSPSGSYAIAGRVEYVID